MERRECFRYIDKMLYLVRDIRDIVKDIRAEQDATKHQNGGGGNNISDTTANAAIRHITPIPDISVIDNKGRQMDIANPEGWVQLYDKIYCMQNKLGKVIMQDRYCAKKSYLQSMYDSDITKDTYYVELDNIYCLALAAACEMKLTSVLNFGEK